GARSVSFPARTPATRQVRTPSLSVEPSTQGLHEIGKYELRDGPADLLTGLLIESVMDAPVDAGHGFFVGGLRETLEVPCDVRQPAGLTPGHGHGHVARATN